MRYILITILKTSACSINIAASKVGVKFKAKTREVLKRYPNCGKARAHIASTAKCLACQAKLEILIQWKTTLCANLVLLAPSFKSQWTTDMVYKHCAMHTQWRSAVSQKNQQRRLESPRTGNHTYEYVCCTAKMCSKLRTWRSLSCFNNTKFHVLLEQNDTC